MGRIQRIFHRKPLSPLTKLLLKWFTPAGRVLWAGSVMRSFKCTCGNQLFFDNSICVCCKHDVGWCPQCNAIVDVFINAGGRLVCSCCKAKLVKCVNYSAHNVCNRFVAADDVQNAETAFCDCCRFNRVVPDLNVEGNQEKWYRLEAAKRRTLFDLNMLGLPYGNQKDGVVPALVFDFKGDIIPDRRYRNISCGQKVYTGHDNGAITINIQEADDIERETLRVNMHEAHRSLLGHFRHEFGHYMWDVLIKGRREPDFIAIFGDHQNPPYDLALKNYYQTGPKPDWLMNYVSAYATMHPWEDFAETFAVYLDMASALDTAANRGLIPNVNFGDVDAMIEKYKGVGIALNEMNRSIGLLDYLPEVFAPPIHQKLKFIHGMRSYGAAAQPGAREPIASVETTATPG
jgi:hypothetical protein